MVNIDEKINMYVFYNNIDELFGSGNSNKILTCINDSRKIKNIHI